MKRISPATVIACVALFVSLGGTSLAASHFLISSVRQIAPSVRRELRGRRGPEGPAGPAGSQGVAGTQGEPGPAGPVGTFDWANTYTNATTVELSTQDPTGSAVAHCRSGDHALTGGFTGHNEIVAVSTLASDNDDGWQIHATLAPGNTTGFVIAWVLCATGSSGSSGQFTSSEVSYSAGERVTLCAAGNPCATGSSVAPCPGSVLGGGMDVPQTEGDAQDVSIFEDSPTHAGDGQSGWVMTVTNLEARPFTFWATAVCA